MKSLDHDYAEVAFSCVKEIESSKYAKEYGRLCHVFPSMVLLNGLRLTAAFFQAKGGEDDPKAKAYLQYIKDLGKAIDIQDWNNEIPESSMKYRHLSRSALRASVWFKRYAETILKVRESQE